MPCAAHLREPRLREVPPVDAAVRVPTLLGYAAGEGRAGTQMGTAEAIARLSNAAGRRAADTLPDRSSLRAFRGSAQPLINPLSRHGKLIEGRHCACPS